MRPRRRSSGPPHRTCATVAGAGAAVAALAHAGPALGAIGPLRRALLPRYAGRGDADHVALTFDDGPQRLSTPRVLDVLADHDVRATFFLLGSSVARDVPLGREMVARGHEVAVHGWHHQLLIRRNPRQVREDLRRAHGIVGDLAGSAPRWYRPPYGVASTAALHAAHELGMKPVLWTAWGRDWTTRATPDSVQRAVLRVHQGGGTVLLHDADTCSAPGSWWTTAAALPGLLQTWQESGLRIGPLGEHGTTLTPLRPAVRPRFTPGDHARESPHRSPARCSGTSEATPCACRCSTHRSIGSSRSS